MIYFEVWFYGIGVLGSFFGKGGGCVRVGLKLVGRCFSRFWENNFGDGGDDIFLRFRVVVFRCCRNRGCRFVLY